MNISPILAVLVIVALICGCSKTDQKPLTKAPEPSKVLTVKDLVITKGVVGENAKIEVSRPDKNDVIVFNNSEPKKAPNRYGWLALNVLEGKYKISFKLKCKNADGGLFLSCDRQWADRKYLESADGSLPLTEDLIVEKGAGIYIVCEFPGRFEIKDLTLHSVP